MFKPNQLVWKDIRGVPYVIMENVTVHKCATAWDVVNAFRQVDYAVHALGV